ncbi:phosphotransferase [Nocardioides sp.]|uniref:phosphotransferase n=1 Tax=Nocardioides sp. TaxID=35761 RepID=UPI003515F0C6
MTTLGAIPTDPQAFTPDLLERLLHTLNPGVGVRDVSVRRVWEWGQGEAVSTSGRLDLDLAYDTEHDLPRSVVLKIARPALPAFPLYRNEVDVYTSIRPWEFLPTPRCLGAWFDPASGSFGLALEDLRPHGARFASAVDAPPLASIESAIRELARLHARFWDPADADPSSAPGGDPRLAWAQTHVAGELHELFDHPDLVPRMIREEVVTTQHKRELLQSVGQDPDSLHAQVRRVQQHQATLPRTLVHGDCHVGNTYVLPGGETGFVDWQLSVRGHFMHDLSYLLVTGLDVATRRADERRLIGLHLDELARHGVDAPPSLEEAFEEYRRAQAWNTYIGWLTCPVANYGWEINVANHVRLLTAYRDLDTAAAIGDLP